MSVFQIDVRPSIAGMEKIRRAVAERRRLWGAMYHNLLPVYESMESRDRDRLDEALSASSDGELENFEALFDVLTYWPVHGELAIKLNVDVAGLGSFMFTLQTTLIERGIAVLVAEPEDNNGWSGAIALEIGPTTPSTADMAFGDQSLGSGPAHKALLDHIERPASVH